MLLEINLTVDRSGPSSLPKSLDSFRKAPTCTMGLEKHAQKIVHVMKRKLGHFFVIELDVLIRPLHALFQDILSKQGNKSRSRRCNTAHIEFHL